MPKHPAQEAWGLGEVPTNEASGPDIANATETYTPFVALSVSDITSRNLERTKHVVLIEGNSIKFYVYDATNVDPEDGDTVIWDSEDRPFVLVHRGAKGDPLWNPRGSYSGGTTYSRGDLVEDQEHSWIYINDTAGAGNAPPTYPTLSNSYWQWVAGRGLKGDQGDMLEHDAFPGLPHKPAFYEDWTVNQFLRQNFSFARASAGTYLDKAGLLRTAGSGDPRFHTYYATGETGLLVEGSRTNLSTYSKFNNAAWSEAAGVFSYNSPGPDGNNDACLIVENNATGLPRLFRNITISSGVVYTASVFAKEYNGGSKRYLQIYFNNGFVAPGSWGAVFDVGNGVVTKITNNSNFTAGMEKCADGWWRCWVTTTPSIGTSAGIRLTASNSPTIPAATNYSGDGVSGIFLTGFQLEAGTTMSSYIDTTSSQVTRAADTVTRSNDDGVLNVAEGTLFAEVVVQHKFAGNIPNRYLASIDDGTLTERISLMYYQTGNGVVGYVHDGGHVEAQLNLTPVNAGDVWRVAIAYASNDVAGSVNGGAVQTDSSVVLPATTKFTIGNVATGPHLFGIVKRIAYWPRRLTNQQIQAITSRTGYFFDVTDNVLRPVSVGADDSGGSGYKVLRIAN